jgi:hypothetical protein
VNISVISMQRALQVCRFMNTSSLEKKTWQSEKWDRYIYMPKIHCPEMSLFGNIISKIESGKIACGGRNRKNRHPENVLFMNLYISLSLLYASIYTLFQRLLYSSIVIFRYFNAPLNIAKKQVSG